MNPQTEYEIDAAIAEYGFEDLTPEERAYYKDRPDCDCDCHLPGQDMSPADCDNCTGLSEGERAEARRPYRCGGPQTGQPRPHTACNCTPRSTPE